MLIDWAYGSLWGATLAHVIHARSSKRWVGWIALGMTAPAWGLLAAGLVERGLRAGHWPLTNRYEFALGWAWTIVTIYLLLNADAYRQPAASLPVTQTGAWVLAVALLPATFAITRPAADQAVAPLLPALRSAWLQIHVLSALVGYGAFGVAAGLGLAQLFRAADPQLLEKAGGLRAVALGIIWLTLSILSGAIWAQNAWGRYWGWDPKETWALAAWLWYLMVLHVRPLRRWRGRRLAGLVVAGLGLILFTFIGVPWLVSVVRLESLHGF